MLLGTQMPGLNRGGEPRAGIAESNPATDGVVVGGLQPARHPAVSRIRLGHHRGRGQRAGAVVRRNGPHGRRRCPLRAWTLQREPQAPSRGEEWNEIRGCRAGNGRGAGHDAVTCRASGRGTWDVCMREDMAAGKRDRAWEREAGDATDSARALKQTGLANRRAGKGICQQRRPGAADAPGLFARQHLTAARPGRLVRAQHRRHRARMRHSHLGLCPDPAIAWPRRGTSFCDYAARFWALPRRRDLTQAGRRARTT